MISPVCLVANTLTLDCSIWLFPVFWPMVKGKSVWPLLIKVCSIWSISIFQYCPFVTPVRDPSGSGQYLSFLDLIMVNVFYCESDLTMVTFIVKDTSASLPRFSFHRQKINGFGQIFFLLFTKPPFDIVFLLMLATISRLIKFSKSFECVRIFDFLMPKIISFCFSN